MNKPLLSERTTTNLLSVFVLAASIALLLFVPHQWLRPLSVGYVVFAVLAVFGIRAYLRRLETVVSALASSRADTALLLTTLLSEPERRLLRLRSQGTPAEISHVLRRRQSALTAVAMGIAVLGICAFILAIVLFSD